MLIAKQISFLDHRELVGSARFGIALPPSEVARRLNAVLEISFDDLGVYEFVGISVDGSLLGFRKHRDAPRPYSYVSCVAGKDVDAKELIATVCSIAPSDVTEFDEAW